jgi:hypothetical protein
MSAICLIWTKENMFVCSLLPHYVLCRHNPTLFNVNTILKADIILPFPHTRGFYNVRIEYPSSQQHLITLLLCKGRWRSSFLCFVFLCKKDTLLCLVPGRHEREQTFPLVAKRAALRHASGTRRKQEIKNRHFIHQQDGAQVFTRWQWRSE